MTWVRIGGPGAMMLVSCGGRLPNGFAELLAVTVRDDFDGGAVAVLRDPVVFGPVPATE